MKPTTLHPEDLAEMHACVLAWAANDVHVDAFRAACVDVAKRIELHLDGQGDDLACARAIEHLFGVLAPPEIKRLDRVTTLFDSMSEAFDAADVRGWVKAFKRLLDLLSEEQVDALMHHVASGATATPMQDWPVHVHEAPAHLQ